MTRDRHPIFEQAWQISSKATISVVEMMEITVL
jgi:hypothetical protein